MQGFDLERDILRQVRDYLAWHGWMTIRFQQGLGSHKGLSDLVAIKDGRTIWIEVKTRRGNLSSHQIKFQEQINLHEGTYWVIRSLDQLMKKLNEKGGRE